MKKAKLAIEKDVWPYGWYLYDEDTGAVIKTYIDVGEIDGDIDWDLVEEQLDEYNKDFDESYILVG